MKTLFSGGSRIFPRGGREPSRGGVNTPNFPENCMKSKEFGRPGGACVPHAPPRSANAFGSEVAQRCEKFIHFTKDELLPKCHYELFDWSGYTYLPIRIRFPK